MFTVADIRNIAVQIERNGEETYRKAAEESDDPEVKAMLIRLADDEKEHARWFEGIGENRELTAEQRELEAAGKKILQDMVGDSTFSLDQQKLGAASSLEKILKASQVLEEDTVLFYEMLSGFIDDGEIRRQLQEIIAEEQKHSEELRELLKKSSSSQHRT